MIFFLQSATIVDTGKIELFKQKNTIYVPPEAKPSSVIGHKLYFI